MTKIGRPSDYSPELALKICLRIAGGESLRKICSDEDMPHRDTVHTWLLKHSAFADQYARAREAQADVLFDECLSIADDASEDFKEKQLGDDGPMVEVVDHEHIARSKLRVDTRKWLAGKLAPKKYGERMALTGPDGGPIKTEDTTARASSKQVRDELTAIFGDLVPRPAAKKPASGNRLVRKGARGGGRKKPGTPAPGKTVARPE